MIKMPARLLPAVINQAGDLASKVLAVDYHVDKAMLEHEFCRLEPLGQLDLYRLGYRSRACKTDQRPRLGYQAVTEHCEAGGDTARCRIGQ